jgi:hypothetical protein
MIRFRHWLVLLVVLGGVVVGVWRGVEAVRWQERPDAVTGVALELQPTSQVIKLRDRPELTLTVINRGRQDVVLVEPGDGSEDGWRTPLIEWSSKPWSRIRCGNVNGLKPGEVFTLKPGESRQLNEWIGTPYLPFPGRYRVSVRYTNDPDLKWDGIPLTPHDTATLEKVHRSTKMSAVSNAVEIVVQR